MTRKLLCGNLPARSASVSLSCPVTETTQTKASSGNNNSPIPLTDTFPEDPTMRSHTPTWGHGLICGALNGLALVLLGTGTSCLGQGTFEPIHVTFDGQPTGTAVFVQQYHGSGMWFRPLGIVGPGNGFILRGGGYLLYPENGTAYLQASLGDSLQFSFIDDSVFDLVSVDLGLHSRKIT